MRPPASLRRVSAVAIALLTALAINAALAQSPRTPQDTHDLLVRAFSRLATRPLPPGDTLVSWYVNPVALHTVHRSSAEMTTGFVRGDGTLGIARVTWAEGRPLTVEVRWTKADSVLKDIRIYRERDSLHLSGTSSHTWPVPSLPWGVADYGMEDMLLPLVQELDVTGGAVDILAYRPYAAKWDSLKVTSQAIGNGTLFTLQASDGKRDWWLISSGGVILQLRREGQTFERRPLEQTALEPEYLRLRSLLPFDIKFEVQR